jgi:RNA polymerase sigma-70 factor (ECF subfamily)
MLPRLLTNSGNTGYPGGIIFLAEDRSMGQRLPPPSPAADNPALDKAPRDRPTEVDFSALVVAHHAALYRYAYRLCGCAAEADDLTQQAFLVAQQKLHQLREADRAAAWLFAVLRSCFLKSLRRQRPANAATLNLEVEQFAGPTPEVVEIDRERLAAALADLAEEFRLVVLMFYFEELSYQEIAEQLEIPIGTVMSRLSRAKGHLRRRLGNPLGTEHGANGAALKGPSKGPAAAPSAARANK